MMRLLLLIRKILAVFSPLESRRPHRHSPQTWRRRRLGAAVLLILLCCLIGGYWHYTSDQRVKAQTIKALEQITGGDVTIGQASLDILREIHIKSLHVYLPGKAQDPKALVFSAKEVLLEHKPWSILTRRLELISIKAQNADLHIWYDRNRHLTNLQLLNVTTNARNTIQRPTILLRQSTVEYQEIDGSSVSPVVKQKVSGRIFPDPKNNQVYQFEFSSLEEGVVKNSSWKGRYQLKTKELLETSGNFFLELIDISSLPSRVASWRRLYDISQPKGEVFTQSRYDPQKGQTVRLTLNNGSLHLPLPQIQIPLHQVNADIVCTQNAIEIKQLSGRYEDFCRFDTQGQIDGYTPDAPFHLKVGLIGINIPQGYWRQLDNPPNLTNDQTKNEINRLMKLLELLPKPARQLILKYTPTGRLDTQLTIERSADPDAPIRYEGTLICKGASLLYKNFPYPLDDVQGSVHFQSDSLVIGPLTSRRDDRQITITGYWHKNNDDQDYQVSIDCRNIPLDQTLYNALNTSQQTLWKQLKPDGNINVIYQISKAPDTTRNDQLDIELPQVDLVYQPFPIPLNDVSGHIKWNKHLVDFTIDQAQTGQGKIRASGRVNEFDRPNQHLACTLQFDDILIEPNIISQMPASLRHDLNTVGLTGRFSGQAQLWTPEQTTPPNSPDKEENPVNPVLRNLQYQVQAQLKNGTLKPKAFDYSLADVTAKGQLNNEKLVIESLTGRHGQGKISLSGTINHSKNYQLHIQADPLQLDDTLHQALHERDAGLWDAFRPKGLAKLQLDINRTADSDNLDYNAVIEPLDTELSFSDLGYPLGKAKGKILLDPQKTTIESLTITNDPTVIIADGILTHHPQQQTDIHLLMKSFVCSDNLFAALPGQLHFLHDRLNLTGTIDADLQVSQRRQIDLSSQWSVQGRLDVKSGAIQKPLLTENIRGSIQGHADYTTNNHRFTLAADIDCPTLHVKKRPLKNFKGRLDYQSDQNTLTISNISSGLCDGRLAGQVQTLLKNKSTGYQMDLTFHNVDVAQLIEAEKPPEKRRKNLKGLVDGHFSLLQPSDLDSRHGNFSFEVKNAVLGTLPVFAQLLHVFNLSLPKEGAFNEATLIGDISGKKTIFESIILKGSAVKLNGTGVMTEPGSLLNLVFVMDSPHDLPDVPVISSFIKAIQPELMQVRVTGTFDEPIVEPIALPGLDDALKQFDENSQNRQPPQKPLPPPPPTPK